MKALYQLKGNCHKRTVFTHSRRVFTNVEYAFFAQVTFSAMLGMKYKVDVEKITTQIILLNIADLETELKNSVVYQLIAHKHRSRSYTYSKEVFVDKVNAENAKHLFQKLQASALGVSPENVNVKIIELEVANTSNRHKH